MDPVATVQALTTACVMAGLLDEHAATSLGPCGPSDVLRLLGELTERWRAAAPPYADVLRLAANGVTDADVAAELGMSVHTVRDIRRRHGLVRARRGAAPEPAWMGRVRDMHARGLTREQMGAETGWAPSTVYQRLSKLRLLTNTTDPRISEIVDVSQKGAALEVYQLRLTDAGRRSIEVPPEKKNGGSS